MVTMTLVLKVGSGFTILIWLVVSTPLKNISQLGLLFPMYGKINMFQTTNQLLDVVK